MKTKYFLAGVYVRTWTNDGRLALHVRRDEGALQFLGLDELKRAVFNCRDRMQVEGSKDFRLCGTDYSDELVFATHEDVTECLTAIAEAVRFVQGNTEDDAWRDLNMSVFDQVRATTVTS